MKSLHIIASKQMGGAERWFLRFLRALQARGHDVRAVVRRASELDCDVLAGLSAAALPLRTVWDPTGEKTVRGNVSHGDGVWKSTDAGRSWTHTGLDDSRHIARIRIHPRNPDLVYAAVMGHLFGPNTERGVYRSSDGGQSWQRVLYVNEQTGAVDLVMDPTNPRILYATTWRLIRTPYSLESGGEGSGIWKSSDGGDSWQSLSDNEGLPAAPTGIAGIAVSPSNPDNLYAIVEAAEGGVFRSRDAGATWQKVNAERKLRQRAWYYSRIYADPLNEDTVYVLNVRFHRSRDGGRSFEAVSTPHADNHDLWIDPADPARMIQANDGGANVSYDGGQTWSTQANQPTAQMYRVSTDNDFPYRVLGGQQDNSTVRIRSRSTFGNAIGTRDWSPTAGGESGHVVADPRNPDIVYGGSYGGYLMRVDHGSGSQRIINVWPDNPMGWGAAELKYRFNWNFPLMFSPHDAETLYAAGNILFRSRDEGQSWQAISPDLTRNIKEKQQSSGGPITQDNTSVEYYGTIFAIAESLQEPGVLWAGSDDGLLHISRDGGANWSDVTPRGLPDEIQINSIEAHPFEAGGLYLAATAYKSDDFGPYLYRTVDYGRSWQRITDGIADDHFTRVIRADHKRPGLLFAGTERGVYFSIDDGENWLPMQLNLPISPVTDLAVKDGDLVAATQGRGYWIFGDLGLMRQLAPDSFGDEVRLFEPNPAYRLFGAAGGDSGHAGENPPAGVVLRYWLASEPEADLPLELTIADASGATIRTFSRKPPADTAAAETPVWGDNERVLDAGFGLNSFEWNMRYPSVEKFDGLVLWNRDLSGPRALPGRYTATLVVGGERSTVSFDILPDPRSGSDSAALRQQFDFVWGINQTLTETHRSIRRLREVRQAIAGVVERASGSESAEDLGSRATELSEKLTRIEEALYQTKLESPQDPLNFPIRLNDKLSGVMQSAAWGDHAPTDSAIEVGRALTGAIEQLLQELDNLLGDELTEFNRLVAEAGIPAVTGGEP